jgi:hypothetical protein
MEEVLRELTETELESVAGGFFDFTLNNQDSNQGVQAQIGIGNNNIDSNQGFQNFNF